MPRPTARIVVGIVLTLLVTAVLAGVVVTSAALTVDVSAGDRCTSAAMSDAGITTPKRVVTVAGNVTDCIAGDGAFDAPSSIERPPSRNR